MPFTPLGRLAGRAMDEAGSASSRVFSRSCRASFASRGFRPLVRRSSFFGRGGEGGRREVES